MKVAILAYVDPGSGLLLWQLILAAFTGFVFSLKKARAFVRHLIRKCFGCSDYAPKLEIKKKR